MKLIHADLKFIPRKFAATTTTLAHAHTPQFEWVQQNEIEVNIPHLALN